MAPGKQPCKRAAIVLITPGSDQAAVIAVRGKRTYGGMVNECVLRKADQIRVTGRR